jgi:hypothetical protein
MYLRIPLTLVWTKAVLISGFLIAFSSFSLASTTVVSVKDSGDLDQRGELFIGGQFSNAVAASWTQSSTFSNVLIDASLASSDASFRSGTAYLTNAIGPQTTASAVLAFTSFTAPFDNPSEVVSPLTVLFSSLTLGPGTYYLVISAPFRDETDGSPLTWQIPENPIISMAPSATLDFSVLANTFFSTVDAFPPASAFLLDPVDHPLFDVVSTPEPQAIWLVLIGLTFAAGLKFRKSLKWKPSR